MLVESGSAMQELGSLIAPLLAPGDVLILTGDLGAGKTTFAQGVARGLGIGETVTSPTFVMSKEYQGDAVRLVHLDVYRIGGADDLLDLWSEADSDSQVTLVEWGAPWVKEFGSRVVELVFTDDDHDGARRIGLGTVSDAGSELAGRIASLLQGDQR